MSLIALLVFTLLALAAAMPELAYRFFSGTGRDDA